jgi:hypothetical protein
MGRLRPSTAARTPGAVVTASLVVIALCLVGLLVAGVLSVIDPFGTTSVDRSGPAVLERIRELEEFTAAEGNFTQDVDLERDARYLPDFLKGERVVALVNGQVRAVVDFSGLDADAVRVSEDRTRIELRLPEPQLSDADISESGTRIVSRQRGLVDRAADFFAGNPVDDSQLYEAAERKVEQAADESNLREQARRNTERWLQTFLGAAGFTDVRISWTEAPA